MLIGLEVEIDESIVAKQKYNLGHLVKEKWVFRGYCSASGEVFLQMVPDRSAATLLPLVEQHIAPGSKIVSDKWPSYRGILGLQVEPKFKHTSPDTLLTLKLERVPTELRPCGQVANTNSNECVVCMNQCFQDIWMNSFGYKLKAKKVGRIHF